jgi:4-amino-4-deoxy-L-arabinose transferase-like glycosyltransferase
VTTSTDIAPGKNTKEIAARIGRAVLICATLYVCYFSHLGAIGFVGPDEPRYAWIARDMAETGDWVTPRLYGRPWFEKPPLYYWGAAICFKLFGVSETAARLPSAISALLATLTMAWLAWRIYGAETARWLLLLLPTTVGMIGFSHAAATDMPFTAMLTIAMVCAAALLGLVPDRSCRVGAQHSLDTARDKAAPVRGDEGITRRRWLALVLFGFFLGLAVLAKGPAGIILCGGAVFFWALFTKRWQDTIRLVHPAAIAAFCITALPWYILCARRNPEFFRIFIIEHNFRRYLTPEFQHIQPVWFYIPILLVAFLPWTAGMLASLVDSRSRCSLNAFFLGCGLFPILFFTMSRSKLPGYILPAVPPLAWLLVNTTQARLARQPHRNFVILAYAITFVLLAITVLRFAAGPGLGSDVGNPPWTTGIWLLPLLAGILGGALAAKHHAVPALCVLQVGVVLATWSLSLGLTWMDPQLSARGVIAASRMNVEWLRSADVFVYDLPRGIHYGLNFYLGRDISDWTPGSRGLVFSSWKGVSRLHAQGFVCRQHLVFPAGILCQMPISLPIQAPGGGKAQ